MAWKLNYIKFSSYIVLRVGGAGNVCEYLALFQLILLVLHTVRSISCHLLCCGQQLQLQLIDSLLLLSQSLLHPTQLTLLLGQGSMSRVQLSIRLGGARLRSHTGF